MPLFGRTFSLRRNGGDDLLPQPRMRQTEVVVGYTQVHLPIHPICFLGEAKRLSGEASVVLSKGAILSLHEGGVDLGADGGVFQRVLQRLLGAKDHLVGDVHHPTFASVLDHLSIQKILGRLQSWVGKPSSIPLPFWLYPLTQGVEDRVLVGGSLVTEEDPKGTVIDAGGFFQQFVRVLLGNASGHKGWHDLVHRIKRQPHPVIAYLMLELL